MSLPPYDPPIPKLDEPTKALDVAYAALMALGHADLAERVMAVRVEITERYTAYPLEDPED